MSRRIAVNIEGCGYLQSNKNKVGFEQSLLENCRVTLWERKVSQKKDIGHPSIEGSEVRRDSGSCKAWANKLDGESGGLGLRRI